jgi:nucleoside-diphosphate-sugar epimerase
LRVLLTGATGLIGSAVLAHLHDEGHEVVAVVRTLDQGLFLRNLHVHVGHAAADPTGARKHAQTTPSATAAARPTIKPTTAASARVPNNGCRDPWRRLSFTIFETCSPALIASA